MEVKLINPLEDSRWDHFVSEHKNGSIYHHSAWCEAIERTYNYVPKHYIAEDGQGQIHAALASFLIKSRLTGNRIVSLPFTPFCDILLTDKTGNEELIDFVKKDGDRANVTLFEIKTAQNTKLLEASRFQKLNNYKLHILPLHEDLGKLKNHFHKSCVQRSIAKAQKSNLQVRYAERERDLKNFYHLYVLTRRKHGLLPHRYLFFKNLWDLFEMNNLMELLLAEYEGKTIAGTLFFKFKNSCYYHFAASDEDYLRLRPNHLLLWTAIKQSHEEGYEYFNFGRSDAGQMGLVAFKKRWGTEEYDLPYFYFPKVSGIEGSLKQGFGFRLATKMAKRTPACILKIGGSLLSKHLG